MSVTGRPVKVSAIGTGFLLAGDASYIERVYRTVADEAKWADIIVLPEVWYGSYVVNPGDPMMDIMSNISGSYCTYILCPMYREQDGARYNTVMLFGRNGDVVSVHDKVFPFWGEIHGNPYVDAGADSCVYETDFGNIGVAICFSVNFPEVWRRLDDLGADIVFWPSAYAGGLSVQAHAINHHYYIVTATQERQCAIYDITGEILVHESFADDVYPVRVTLDLDRCVYHENFNVSPIEKMILSHHADIDVCWMAKEHWYALSAKRPGVLVRDIARRYGMEEIRSYIRRSRNMVDEHRGYPFITRLVENENEQGNE